MTEAETQPRLVWLVTTHSGDAVALEAQRVVGAVASGADQLVQPVQQLGIIQQQGVQVQELADLPRQRAVQALA